MNQNILKIDIFGVKCMCAFLTPDVRKHLFVWCCLQTPTNAIILILFSVRMNIVMRKLSFPIKVNHITINSIHFSPYLSALLSNHSLDSLKPFAVLEAINSIQRQHQEILNPLNVFSLMNRNNLINLLYYSSSINEQYCLLSITLPALCTLQQHASSFQDQVIVTALPNHHTFPSPLYVSASVPQQSGPLLSTCGDKDKATQLFYKVHQAQ